MAQKSKSSKADTVVAVAVAAAVAWKIGSAIYGAFNKHSASESDVTTEKQKAHEEEKKEDHKEYMLDADVDIDSVTCPITCCLINEPASTTYGHLFELSAIREWVEHNGTCPLTH